MGTEYMQPSIEAKLLQINKSYFALRYSLIKQINDIANIADGDADKRLLASLKRTLKGLRTRFERTGVKIDAEACAKILLDAELPKIQEQPLRFCRYYKGENASPLNEADNTGLLGNYERFCIEFVRSNRHYLESELIEYIHYGLMDFSSDDGVPISFKVILFNRYCHWNMADVESFKKWYYENYLTENNNDTRTIR